MGRSIHVMYRIIKILSHFVISSVFLLIYFTILLVARKQNKEAENARLVWGSTGVLTFAYWSKAMRKKGYNSQTFVEGAMKINRNTDWDILLGDFPGWRPLRPYLAFLYSVFKFDVFFISFDGYFLGKTPLRFYQAQLLKLAGKKIVSLPYGSDAYVYRDVYSPETRHALLQSYPRKALEQDALKKNQSYWVKYSDVVIPGFMGLDGLGRWDVLTPSPISLDLSLWHKKNRENNFDGENGTVVVAHCPNHRGFKGTEFVLEAVQKLQLEGLKIDLRLIEGIPNSEVQLVLCNEVDLLIDQLLFTGYALNATEGMASGLPVIGNFERNKETINFRRWSFLEECPIVSASPETLQGVLRQLVKSPKLRSELGEAGRSYTEKYHSLSSGAYLFENTLNYLFGEKIQLLNLYHPLLGEYPNHSPKIQHPLVNNRIVDG